MLTGWKNWRPRQRLLALALLAALGGYWLLPVSGQVVIVPGDGSRSAVWPQIQIAPAPPGPNQHPDQQMSIEVTDVTPWGNVLVTVNGEPAKAEGWSANSPGGTWTWKWSIIPKQSNRWPDGNGAEVAFYRDCDGGCVERGRAVIGGLRASVAPTPSSPIGLPTKLGVVFANPDRDWHGRSGWVADLTYARLTEEPYWKIDDLAARVYQATAKGLKVLVRVDYDRGQSLPPADDYLALAEYLRYIQRLARDDRLRDVYGYIVGSGFNALDANSQAPDRAVSPAWYARLFNGYGEAAARSDNVVQAVRRENALTKVLVGPVRPWNRDQGGERHAVDAPWLNYMNTLVAALDEAARLKAAAGVALAAPDGFALQTPGRPDAPEMYGRDGAEEPRLDLRRPEWGNAQVGFRVYRDWLDIVNGYQTTRGLPAYLTAANTFAPDDGTPPAQNYPQGWLTTALDVVDEDPQILALAWFMDGPLGDDQWDWFSLSRRSGRMIDAASEFDALLQRGP